MKIITQLALVALISGMAFAAHAEPGGYYGRSKVYDIGNTSSMAGMELGSGCMDMPCCKDMKMDSDCMKMPCCQGMAADGKCLKDMTPKSKK